MSLVLRILIKDFLFFALDSFVAGPHNGVFFSKTTEPQIFADGFQVVVQMPDRLYGRTTDLDLFPIIPET